MQKGQVPKESVPFPIHPRKAQRNLNFLEMRERFSMASIPEHVPPEKDSRWVDAFIYHSPSTSEMELNNLNANAKKRMSLPASFLCTQNISSSSENRTRKPHEKESNCRRKNGDDQNKSVTSSCRSFRIWNFVGLLILVTLLGLGLRTFYTPRSDDCHLSADEIQLRWIRLQAHAKREIYGQHIAVEGALNSIYAHLSDPNPGKALVLTFNGMIGTGKTFLSQIIARNLFNGGLKSPYVKGFFGPHHFLLDPILTRQNKMTLTQTISKMMGSCRRGLFIFDDVDKMPSETLDALTPFIGHSGILDGVDYRRGIYIFLSNAGSERINNITHEALQAGKRRSSLTFQDFDEVFSENELDDSAKILEEEITIKTPSFGDYVSSIWQFIVNRVRTCNCSIEIPFATDNNQVLGGLTHSDISRHALVDHFLPFMPLEKAHVMLCIQREIKRRKIYTVDLMKVASRIHYFPAENEIFAREGCKNVHSHLAYYVTSAQNFFKKEKNEL